jgi:MFS family permease
MHWNFYMFLTDYVWFGVAFAFFSPDTVVPGLVRQLIDSAFAIGLVSAIFRIGWLLPQLAVARAINDKPRKMPYLVLGLIGRIAFFLVALILQSKLPRYPAMLILCTVCFVFFTSFDALAGVAWFDIMARAIPPKMRGRMFGIGQAISGLIGIGAGTLIKLILEHGSFPDNYAVIFALAGLMLIPSSIAIILVREPPPDVTEEREEQQKTGSWTKRLMANPDYRQLTICRILIGMMALATPFYVAHARAVLQLPESAIGDFIIAQTITGVVASTVLGVVHERQGPRAVIRIGAAAATVAPIFALAAHLAGGGWLAHTYPIVFVSLGIANATWIMGFFNYVLEIAPDSMRAAYVGTINSIVWPLTLASVVGGWLLEITSYSVLFIATAVFVGASFLLSLGLRSSRPATMEGKP